MIKEKITGKMMETSNFRTFLNEAGKGNDQTILFLHGSGPGVTALANWEPALNDLSEHFYCLAPDLYGFAQSSHPENPPKSRQKWLAHWVLQVEELLNELGLEKVNVVGNSLGCSIVLECLMEIPERFDRVVLMGPGGTPVTKMSAELGRARFFYDNPTKKQLKKIMEWFVFNPEKMALKIEGILEDRYETAMRPEVQRSNEAFFQTVPLNVPPTALERIPHDILLVHGKNDRVCSVESSHYYNDHLPNSNLFIINKCGHWAQLEHENLFNNLILNYFKKNM